MNRLEVVNLGKTLIRKMIDYYEIECEKDLDKENLWSCKLKSYMPSINRVVEASDIIFISNNRNFDCYIGPPNVGHILCRETIGKANVKCILQEQTKTLSCGPSSIQFSELIDMIIRKKWGKLHDMEIFDDMVDLKKEFEKREKKVKLRTKSELKHKFY